MSEQSTALATTTNLDDAALMAGLVPEGYTLKPKMLVLVHKSDEGKIAGRLLDPKSNFQFDKMDVVPLEFRPGRVYFPPDENQSSAPICRSNDGKFPILGNDELVPQDGGKGCKNCQWSQWKKLKGQNGKTINVKPPCQETLLFTFLDKETGFVYRLNAKGMNLAPVKDFRQTLFEMVMMAKAKGKVLPHFALSATMSTTKVVGKKGTYYVCTFSAPQPIEDPTAYGPIYESMVLRRNTAEEDPYNEEPSGEEAVNQAVQGEYVEA